MKEADFYTGLKDNNVRCELCPHMCSLTPDETGVCMGRKNIDGKLYSLTYGEIVSMAVDPIDGVNRFLDNISDFRLHRFRIGPFVDHRDRDDGKVDIGEHADT